MIYTTEVQHMCPVAKGAYHGPAPIPEEGKWVQAKEISDISGFTHGVGWCAPQQGACKLTLNIKNGIIEEALVETIGCSGMTHSAAMASEILIGGSVGLAEDLKRQADWRLSMSPMTFPHHLAQMCIRDRSASQNRRSTGTPCNTI